MVKIITVAEAARNLSEVVDRVYHRGEATTLIRSGRPVARIVPVAPGECTGRVLAERLKSTGRFTSEEARDFERDIRGARAELNQPPSSSWD